MNDTVFFFYWISFSILVLAAGGIVFYWAFRRGLFKDQERARHLALWAEMPEAGLLQPQVPTSSQLGKEHR
jgi:cbb3-type cytochrome oxidase maturation protein